MRILVVGVGSIGERHVRCFQSTGRAEVAICETQETRRRAVAEQYGIREAYHSLEDALATSAPFQVGVICTPADHHVAMAIRLAESGQNLLIEKPLSTSTTGLNALCEAVQARPQVVGVAYVYRQHPALASMRRAIAQGKFGAPLQLVATCGQHFPTYRPAYRDIYYAKRESGGGAIQDALTHIINVGQWIVGPVNCLVADAGHLSLPGVQVEDTVHVLARHGQVMGNYSLNQHQAPNEVTISVVCEQGTARFEYHKNRWRWMLKPDHPWTDESLEELQRDDLFVKQANCFLDSVEQERPFVCTLDDAVHSLKINLAIYASLDSRNWQTIEEAS